MGYGIDFMADIYISHKSFDSRWQIEEEIRDEQDNIASNKALIYMYAASTPKDVHMIENDENACLSDLFYEIKDRLESIEESYNTIFRLNLLLSELDKNPDLDIKGS
jgi:hypothetical protein